VSNGLTKEQLEYFRRRNPYYFIRKLYDVLDGLDLEAKDVLPLYKRDINVPVPRTDIPFETPYMYYLKLKRYGYGGTSIWKAVSKLQHNPHTVLVEQVLKVDKETAADARGEELNYLWTLERYKLRRMKIIGWSIIRNAYYVMDWASRVADCSSAAFQALQTFTDELTLPEGFAADLSKLTSLAMDVVGIVKNGMGSPQMWLYKARAEEHCGTVKHTHVKPEEILFIKFGDPLYTLGSGLKVKFEPVGETVPKEEKEYWRIPIWGLLATFFDIGETIEWRGEERKGSIIMILFTCYARVLTDKFEDKFYGCWNHIKMVKKKLETAMELLTSKQRLLTQLPPPPPPEEEREVTVRPIPEEEE